MPSELVVIAFNVLLDSLIVSNTEQTSQHFTLRRSLYTVNQCTRLGRVSDQMATAT